MSPRVPNTPDTGQGVKPIIGHTHHDERGFLVKCYHRSRNLMFTWQFWIGTTLGFPLEHFIYQHIPPFIQIAQLLNIH